MNEAFMGLERHAGKWLMTIFILRGSNLLSSLNFEKSLRISFFTFQFKPSSIKNISIYYSDIKKKIGIFLFAV